MIAQTIKSRAAVAWGPGQPLSMEDVDVMPPQQGEVRIRMIATGVCHTDAFTERANGFRCVSASANSTKCRHTWIIPAINHTIINQLFQFTLTGNGIVDIQTPKFILCWLAWH